MDWDEVDRAEHPWFGDNRDRAPTLRERCAIEARRRLQEEERNEFEAQMLDAAAALVDAACAWDCAEYSDAHVHRLADSNAPDEEHTAGGVPEPEAEPTIFGPRHSCEEAAKLTCKILLACFADEGLSRLSRDRDAMRAQLSARKAQVGTERCALRPAFVLAIEEHLTRSQEAVAPRIRGKSETMMAPVFRRALDQLHVRLQQGAAAVAVRGAHQEAKEAIAVCRSEAYAPIQAYADMMAVLNGGGIEAVEADLEVRIDASDGRAYPLRSFPDVCVQPAVASLRRRTVT